MEFRLNNALSFAMGDETAPYTFSRSLQELSGWDSDFAALAIIEYKKYMLLKVFFPEAELPPAQAVDTVWHLHLLYTLSYQAFCAALGAEFIDHDLDHGCADEARRIESYADTLSAYETLFGQKVPLAIWGLKPLDELACLDALCLDKMS